MFVGVVVPSLDCSRGPLSPNHIPRPRSSWRGRVEALHSDPPPAVLLRHGEPEQPELLHPVDDLIGELVAMFELVCHGDDVLVHELADHLDDRGLFLVEIDQPGRWPRRHGYPSPSGLAKSASRFCRFSPAAWPRAESCSAIFRLASSIISFPNITAPRNSTSVACR